MDMPSEQERIAQVYRQWHGGAALPRYAWHRPEVMQQAAARARILAALFRRTVGLDLAGLRVLDVGCGSGQFLRQLIDWGARPANLAGTELQSERLDAARALAPGAVRWHLGELDKLADGGFDLVSAQTVFSSILDDAARRALAAAMWRKLRPGGWCLVFDFRYDNPANRNVRRVTRAELARLWPAAGVRYRSLLLAPPLARRMAGLPHLLPEALATLVPPLRSHFVFMARKGG
ncbi:class I SAM-dependent methyltransferase [Massilia sp. GCM10023247]|uniref:class I SAM-dependent methyltransferase n=1 Tax=Massilia sp. GCM10023247 TaxID=3252643 RepID=UPI00360B101A